MFLEDAIYVRKSCRKYDGSEVDLNLIDYGFSKSKSLIDENVLDYSVLTRDEVSLKTGWAAPYYLSIESEKCENYKENIGFVFQQLSLYLQSQNVGSCWVGMGKPINQNGNFEILFAFGKSSDLTRTRNQFKRKSLDEISDYADDKLIPAQLAPSAVNSQPWYFKHSDGGFDVYQVKANFLKRKIIGKWSLIDVGIALAHLYVANRKSFEFFKKSNFDDLKNRNYIGSIII